MDIPGNKNSIYTCEKILPVNQRCEKKIPCSNDKNNNIREKILPINQQCKKIPYSNVRVSRHANLLVNEQRMCERHTYI